MLGSFTNSSTTTGTQVWQQFSTSFTAAGTSTTLAFINGDPASDNTNGLDLVDLEVGSAAVPEPASLVLVGSALALLAAFGI